MRPISFNVSRMRAWRAARDKGVAAAVKEGVSIAGWPWPPGGVEVAARVWVGSTATGTGVDVAVPFWAGAVAVGKGVRVGTSSSGVAVTVGEGVRVGVGGSVGTGVGDGSTGLETAAGAGGLWRSMTTRSRRTSRLRGIDQMAMPSISSLTV